MAVCLDHCQERSARNINFYKLGSFNRLSPTRMPFNIFYLIVYVAFLFFVTLKDLLYLKKLTYRYIDQLPNHHYLSKSRRCHVLSSSHRTSMSCDLVTFQYFYYQLLQL